MSESYTADEISKLIESIRSSNMNQRLNALSNLHHVAAFLGRERTENELIPYTMETADHSDACYVRIAKELNKIYPSHTSLITVLKALRQICEKEDQAVRAPALKTLFRIGRKLSEDDFNRVFKDFVFVVSEDRWYPLRAVGASLICQFYRKFAKNDQKIANQIFLNLSSDKNTIVRKSLASSLPTLVHCISGNKAAADIACKSLKILSADNSPAVLIEVPKSIGYMATNNSDFAVECAAMIYRNGNWQAKSALIAQMDRICTGKNKNALKLARRMAETASKDLNDTIRTSIARQISFIYGSNCFPDPDDFRQFATTLITDTEKEVRAAAAISLGEICKNAPEFLDAALSSLINDSEIDVRVAALKAMAENGSAIDTATSNLEELIGSAENWRIRKSVAELLPKIAANLTESDFDLQVYPSVKYLFNDDADEVRKEVISSLIPIMKKYGTEWTQTTVVKLIRYTFKKEDYMLRKAAVEAVIRLNLKNECNDILRAAAKDPISNVRLVLARDLKRPNSLLSKLAKDPDPDVAYFASLP